jgi:hypothetical protein
MIDKKMEKTTIEEQEKKIAKWECMNIWIKNQHADFFVYNNRTEELLPFKKNDFMIYENGSGYLRFDWTSYISYDDNGIEIWRF